ncbi:BglG family transcription antiterminator [Clostridium sediminicola]|uniref:BglG family transcription antiterminator n=1 Tax=Clostridium sediminicola TaxID=3114879 RepID=UPI0031F1C70E
MCYMLLDSRSKLIMEYLVKKEEYVTIDNIAEFLGESRRRIYYDFIKINKLMEEANLTQIKSKRNKGVKLLKEHKEFWKDFVVNYGGSLNYIFNQDERVAIIICELILYSESKGIDEISEFLGVSRNTIFSDMKIVKKKLAEYKVRLTYNQKNGYVVKGDYLKCKAVLLYYISKIYPLIKQNILNYLENNIVKGYLAKLKEIEALLGIQYYKGTLETIALLMLSIKNTKNKNKTLLKEIEAIEDIEDIKKRKEYSAVNEVLSELDQTEKLYISLHLTSAQVVWIPEQKPDEHKEFVNYAKLLVEYFELLTGVDIEYKNQLIYNLSSHLSKAIYRYKYGILENNIATKDVEKRYSELYRIVSLAADKLSKKLGYPINNAEKSCLTAYFGSHIRKYNISILKLKVLLVVPENAEYSKGLKKEIEKSFSIFKIVDVVTPRSLRKYNSKYDAIISTIALKFDSSYVYISEHLSKDDKNKIFNYFMNLRMLNYEKREATEVFERIKHFIPKENQTAAFTEIKEFFNDKSSNIEKKNKIGLMQLIKNEYVQCIENTESWRDAIAHVSLPLLEDGSINEEYVDAMIMNVEAYGSYSYIAPGVFLAHAKPEDGVNRLSMSIMTIKEGVQFPENKIVKLLIVLSPIDNKGHFEALKDVFHLCVNEDNIKKITKASNDDMVYETIQNLIEKKA